MTNVLIALCALLVSCDGTRNIIVIVVFYCFYLCENEIQWPKETVVFTLLLSWKLCPLLKNKQRLLSFVSILEYGSMIVTIAILRVKISAAVFLALFGSLKVLQRAFCSHAYSGRKDGHFY